MEEILMNEIARLNLAIKKLGSINFIDNKTGFKRANQQKNVNQAFSLIVDVKMDLEKIKDRIGEKNGRRND